MDAGRLSRTAGLVAAAITLCLTAGCGLLGGSRGGVSATRPVAAPATLEATPEDVAEPAPRRTTAPAPSRTSTGKPKPRTSATPTEDPNNFQEPACARHEGRKVTKKQAKSALTTAAAKRYWPTSAPKLKLSADLVKSVAWHESGWQSDIVNCDGGRGLMQVMPDTVTMINNRFGQSFVATDYKQNALVGANYLAWLTKYFGDNHFRGSYDLSPGKCSTHSSMCLLNVVIAGYNSGPGAVDELFRSKTLPNPQYVDSVRSLMKSCYCDRY